jgi:catechol 2,3-dioxygenase-like lactoylglutathione lyase family enzyme
MIQTMKTAGNSIKVHPAPRRVVHVALAVLLSAFAVAQATAKGPQGAGKVDRMPPETQPAVPSTVPPLNGIAHIAIRVKDIAASVAFYNKLGFEQAFAMTGKDGNISQSFIKLNDRQFIELYPVNPQNPTQDKPEFLHLCFEGADLNAIHDYYVAEGLTPIAVRKAGAGNLLFTLKGPMQFSDPQNMEYTQYMPESMHSKDFGQHLGMDRIADKLTVVTLAMQDPAAAKAFYLDKIGFTASAKNPMLLNLPGVSGEQIEIVPVAQLGAKSSITLTTASVANAESLLTNVKIAFIPAGAKSDSAIIITDPDGNLINIKSRQ